LRCAFVVAGIIAVVGVAGSSLAFSPTCLAQRHPCKVMRPRRSGGLEAALS